MGNGLFTNLSNIHQISDVESRSLCGENPNGEKGKGGMAPPSDKGAARELGVGWKCRPCITVKAGETATIADIAGPGAVQSWWMCPNGNWRFSILRIYWDDQEQPSVECPVGDFHAMGWGIYAQLSSLAICVNPGSALNCYWPMPFKRRCRITVTNIAPDDIVLFYQINYALGPVGDDAGYFHAQFRRVNPNPYKQDYTIVDGIQGKGHYAGTYMAWGVNNNGWWGEGEVKFFMDGDRQFPTICGTGTEDYFGGSYNFENQETHQYQAFCTPYCGMHQVIRGNHAGQMYKVSQRFGLYRWHLPDPIRFKQDLRVTIQDLGWRSGGRYLPQMSDLASVAYWYQTLPTAPFPALPDKDYLEVI
jgi:hypothetical protein